MSKNLIIVESPAKCKTIQKYLGKDYEVLASYGHVRDLIPKEGAVDPENHFAMKYELGERSEKHYQAIVKALKKADTLMLATDPDREGEAISWHVYELLKNDGLLDGKDIQRVVFHEITKRALEEAVAHPRTLSMDLVNAQQARRALDYLVGFNLSPLLWKKIFPGLSAGRVQSPALRLIVEREEEIEAFIPQEYWSVLADLEKDTQPFNARLTRLNDEKVEQFTINNESLATHARDTLLAAANGVLEAVKVEKKQRKRNPAAPFTTSTLQQEAVRKLGFSASRTMRIAQQLYEGIDIGEGTVGLITYMRTDSVTLSQDALTEIRDLIYQRYGKDNLPDAPNVYTNKSKNAQEAHEAIRPSSALRTPEDMKKYLDADQFKLYSLIWKRAVACQMIHATLDQVAVDLAAGDAGMFRANGSTVRHPGFMTVYQEDADDKKAGKDDERKLPEINEGDKIPLKDIVLGQHFTEPPPRFTEASLVKALEEYGIGRPSTYASIISTLQNRKYVEMDQRRFFPTDTGRIVTMMLKEFFTQYVDYDFTANLEDGLDTVSRGEKEWIPLLDEFWKPFIAKVEQVGDDIPRPYFERPIGTDPKTGKPVSVRVGRYGSFVQIGTKDDEEKPQFASLRPGQNLFTVKLDEALELFKLPRALGEVSGCGEEFDGKKISANIGRFGPYLRYGDKYASLKEPDDPYTVTAERALELVQQKVQEDREKVIKVFDGTDIQILKGRWGPYITDGNKNAKIPKELKETPEKLDQATCEKLLEVAPERRGRGKKKADAKKTAAKKTAAKKTASKKKTTSKKKASAKKTASKKKASARKKATARTADSEADE